MSGLHIIELVLGILAGLGILIAGVGYSIGKFMEGRVKARTEDQAAEDRTQKIYKDLADAQEKRLGRMEDEARENTKQVSKLQGVIEEQNKQRKWFEDILVAALDVYFKTNPELAGTIHGKINEARDSSVKTS